MRKKHLVRILGGGGLHVSKKPLVTEFNEFFKEKGLISGAEP
jgi:hypothetical protein